MSDEPESMTLTAQYSLLDARARDQRSIMLYALSILCTALGGLAVAALAKNDAGVWIAIVVIVTMGWLAVTRWLQVMATILLAEQVRRQFKNSDDVPPIDVDISLKTIVRWVVVPSVRKALSLHRKRLAAYRGRVELLAAPGDQEEGK